MFKELSEVLSQLTANYEQLKESSAQRKFTNIVILWRECVSDSWVFVFLEATLNYHPCCATNNS